MPKSTNEGDSSQPFSSAAHDTDSAQSRPGEVSREGEVIISPGSNAWTVHMLVCVEVAAKCLLFCPPGREEIKTSVLLFFLASAFKEWPLLSFSTLWHVDNPQRDGCDCIAHELVWFIISLVKLKHSECEYSSGWDSDWSTYDTLMHISVADRK